MADAMSKPPLFLTDPVFDALLRIEAKPAEERTTDERAAMSFASQFEVRRNARIPVQMPDVFVRVGGV